MRLASCTKKEALSIERARQKRDYNRILAPWQTQGKLYQASELFLENYLASWRAYLNFINWAFCELEATFLEERMLAENPELTHDELMLRICRNQLAAKLKQRFPQFSSFIDYRKRLQIELPALPSKPRSTLDQAIEEALERRQTA
jgi:hypothetical protein